MYYNSQFNNGIFSNLIGSHIQMPPQLITIGESSHLSLLAEDEGFEPPWDCSQTVFKTYVFLGT